MEEEQPAEIEARARRAARGRVKEMQAASVIPPPPAEERRIRVTLRRDNGYEYHQVFAESVVRALIDPERSDSFIKLAIADAKVHQVVKHRFLHTSYIAEVDVHDEMEFDL